MVTGFSIWPLELASLIAFTFILFGLGVFVNVAECYLIRGDACRFPYVASIIAIFSGAQLFALGIIGEYLARMHFRTMNRPPYVIGSVYQSQKGE